MRAMILAAGLGTRLKPLTDNCPKALLKAGPYTLLQFAILKLKHSGFNRLIINAHHHASMIIDYLKENQNFGCEIEISDESDGLLDTGGGIKKAAWFFSDKRPFLVYNADIVGNLDLKALYDYHLQRGSIATLVVRDRKTQRYLLFDDEMQLCGWENIKSGERRISQEREKNYNRLAFSGIHIINPGLFDLTDQQRSFSIIDTYLALAKDHVIGGYHDQSTLWADAGKPESLAEAGKIAEQIIFD